MDKQIPINPTEEVWEKPLDTDMYDSGGNWGIGGRREFHMGQSYRTRKKPCQPGCLVML